MVAYTKNIKQFNKKGGTAAKFPLSSTKNAPVRRVYKKNRPVTKVSRNKNAIMTLARQVKTLQQQRFGEIQTHTQYSGYLGLVSDLNKLKANRPFCFCINNFYDQDIYKGDVNSGIATYGVAGTFHRQTYLSDLNDEYEWNARRNTDIVSPIEYKPVFTRLNIEFAFNPAFMNTAGQLRITILKIKPYQTSNKLAVALPTTLGAYRNLAEQVGAANRNYFDKSYHQVLMDKWISVKAPPAAQAVQGEYKRYCRIDFRYPDMVLKPDITAHPANQTFWTNTKTAEQIWCLISTSAQLEECLTYTQIGKFDTWRDAHGTA